MSRLLIASLVATLSAQTYIADYPNGTSETIVINQKSSDRLNTSLPGWCCATTIGEQRTIVMTYQTNYQELYDSLFGPNIDSLTSFYRENSNNQIWFSGDVLTGITIQDDSLYGTCSNLIKLSDEFDSVARARGFDLDQYTRRIYAMPINCNWSGFSTLGAYGSGNPTLPQFSRSWVRGLPGPIHHEMGHGLGLAHANRYGIEYGDPTDRMGQAPRRFNAPHQIQMAWIPFLGITTSGQYLIEPLENNSGTRILRLPKPSTNEYYYLSYRQNIGHYDSGWYPSLISGVHIHTHNGINEGVVTNFLDTKPWTSDYFDSPLSDGLYYVGEGFKVEQLSHSASSVLVNITLGSFPPQPPPPSEPKPCRPRGNSGHCK